MAAAHAAARESAYFGSAAAGAAAAAANSFSPYAAAYAAQNMMNWNSYSLATYQGLQREGVTYGMHILESVIFQDSQRDINESNLGREFLWSSSNATKSLSFGSF